MRVGLLLERPVGDPITPVINELVGELQRGRCEVEAVVPQGCFVDLRGLDASCDLYVSKASTELLMSLTSILSDRGAHVINSFRSSSFVRDKARATAAMMAADLPVPGTCIAGSARLAYEGFGKQPIIVKPVSGTWGEGIEIAHDEVEIAAISNGPHFAQTYDRVNGYDLKVYVIAEEVFVIRRRVCNGIGDRSSGELCRTEGGIERLARATMQLFGLEVGGIDLVETSCGLTIVDVNSFPGFVGVPDAARRLAHYITGSA